LDLAGKHLTTEELEEVFPRPPLREVAFEIRFSPRLRVQAELWRLQEQLRNTYPEVSKENALQPSGTILDVAVFANPTESRVIKVTHQSFLMAFTRYTNFEDLKVAVLDPTEQFCSTFEIESFTRLGLRYVNEIVLPSSEPSSLLKYVRPIIDLNRFPVELTPQFAVELHTQYGGHLVTVRTALLLGGRRTYILDIDCHTSAITASKTYADLLDKFHDGAQRMFLEHVTEEYKEHMRGKK
jgi:uncharacterized protein (TIGR04255 family)